MRAGNMMKDGIYTVVFESNLASFGEGIAVVCDGRVHGGDIGFTCRGQLQEDRLLLEVMQYNRDIPSTLGMEGDYRLRMRYREVEEGEYWFTGHVQGHPESCLQAHAVYLTPLLNVAERGEE